MAFPSVAARTETALTTAGTSFTINFTQTTDHYVLIFISLAITGTISAGDGFTNLTNNSARSHIIGKKLDGSEGGNVVVTITSSKGAAVAYNITGYDQVQGPEFSTIATGTSTAPNATILSPTGGAKDYLWFTWFHQDGEELDDDTWVTGTPANYSNLLQKTSGTGGLATTNSQIGSAERTNNAASEDPAAFTASQSLAWRAYTVAVHPVPAASTISPSSTGSTESVNTPSLILSPISFVPAAVDTAEASGTPVLLAGAVSIIVTSIASDEAVGSHTLVQTIPSTNISPTSIDSAEALGTPTLVLSNINVAPSSITTGEAVGSHTLKVVSSISPSSTTTGEALGTPTLLHGNVNVSPSSITTGEVVNTPTLLLGNVNISPASVTPGEVTGTPALLRGNVNIVVGGIPSGESVGVPNLQAPIAGQSVSPTSISSSELFGLPVLIVSNVNIVAESAASAEALGFPVLVPGQVRITIGGISSTELVGQPVLIAAGIVTPGNWGKVNRTPTWSTTKSRGWNEARDSLVKTRKNEGNK